MLLFFNKIKTRCNLSNDLIIERLEDQGYYDSESKKIHLNNRFFDCESSFVFGLFILLHECRHAIQFQLNLFNCCHKKMKKAYQKRKKFYLTLEEDADQWACKNFTEFGFKEEFTSEGLFEGYCNFQEIRSNHLMFIKDMIENRRKKYQYAKTKTSCTF